MQNPIAFEPMKMPNRTNLQDIVILTQDLGLHSARVIPTSLLRLSSYILNTKQCTVAMYFLWITVEVRLSGQLHCATTAM